MMVEIKLRAWDGIKMHYLSTEHFDDMVAFRSPEHFEGDVQISWSAGVKDDAEKEIYQGDIIEIYNVGAVGKPEHYIGAVEFENGSFICDRADKSKSIPLHEVVGASFSVEVIGNIYENQNILRSVRFCDCCGNNMYDGYYHEDSGDTVCDRECGKKHFDNFEQRNETLEIMWTSFEY